jgi:hypothetical protein
MLALTGLCTRPSNGDTSPRDHRHRQDNRLSATAGETVLTALSSYNLIDRRHGQLQAGPADGTHI